MPANIVQSKRDETLWNRAKAQAKKQGQDKNYKLIMHIYQNMKKSVQDDSEQYRRAAKYHSKMADEHRRTNPIGGNTMSRWRQESAHEDAQEAHREAAKVNREAIIDPSKREEAEDARDAANTHPRAEEIGKAMSINLMEEMDKLMKAACPDKVIGRTSEGKDVYSPKKDALEKKKKKAAPAEEEENEEGNHGHHRDKALAHLQAAQAHARAASSAKKMEEAKDHKEAVSAAQQASEAAMGDKKVKKSDRVIYKNNLAVNTSSEQRYLDLLEKGTIDIGGQADGIREDGRHRLLGMRGERLKKGGVAGGTIHQGEHDAQGSRGGDMRETIARAQCLTQMVEMDPAGNRGQGGLSEWFEDAWDTEQTQVNVPLGMAGYQKSEPLPVQIIDDGDPCTKAQMRAHPAEGHASIIMAYQGNGRDE